MKRFFEGVQTLEDLKATYKKLAMANHPDRGGDLETMKAINAEYDEMFNRVSHIHRKADGKMYEKATSETAETFRDIIDQLIKMDGIKIEVIGCFIWVSGDTKPHKDGLKKLGFRWHSKKMCWYKAPDDYHKRSKKPYAMDEIRAMYGVQFETETETKKKIGQ